MQNRSRNRGRGQQSQQFAQVEVLMLPQLLNSAVASYFKSADLPDAAAEWQTLPEVPTSEEITLPLSKVPSLAPNQATGPWSSIDSYLGSHYKFLREEAVRPLREAVNQLKVTPDATEATFNGTIGIYEKVRIIGTITASRGIAMRVTFSTRRAGKKILWQQAKRLLSGSLVALTPSKDMFTNRTVVATVASRSNASLDLNPPELELFFARSEELELDPAVEWTLVEARSSFFEAERHTMLALQKIMSEPFPLSEHLINVTCDVQAPIYLSNRPIVDVSPVMTNYGAVNILQQWPIDIKSQLDASQRDALKRMLTQRIAIVQGPPGTGKTFVSVQAIMIMLANHKSGDPPIILTCQTNHALDQLLRHVAEFEKSFVRLGSRSQDEDVIRARTLKELRKLQSKNLPGCAARPAYGEMDRIAKGLEQLLLPLKLDNTTLDPTLLRKYNLINEAQAESLEAGANQWIQDALLTGPRSPFQVWLSDKLKATPYKPQFEDFGFDYEEADLEYEQLKEIEAEGHNKDEMDYGALPGTFFTLADNFVAVKATIDDAAVKQLLAKENDLWKIPESRRSAVYRFLQTRLKQEILNEFRARAKRYNAAAERARVGRFEQDEVILRDQKIIGVTTTGLSMYRGLLASLKCKIVLVEEAAETLEAPVIAACLPTLEHLILVGDHKQLRPQCKIKEHEKPLLYNISLFERLVINKLALSTLTEQRRMIPEVRRILRPIYGDIIKDHVSVKDPKNRPDVPGMGGINSWWFSHAWPEHRNNQMSCINLNEARMITGFVEYLKHNGVDPAQITILTFYNGQRTELLHCLRRSTSLSGDKFMVVTVDSYQGEENKIVILSLVRSNSSGQIGFLGVDNRVCVALSRAQCGFYIFGNSELLVSASKTWKKVISTMARGDKHHPEDTPRVEPQRYHEHLPLTCTNHGARVEVKEPSVWTELSGGCTAQCAETLSCGHTCPLTCHPFDHTNVQCLVSCTKILPCGHQCSETCSKQCICTQGCRKRSTTRMRDNSSSTRARSHPSSRTSAHSQENDTPTKVVPVTAAPITQQHVPEKEEWLIDF